MDIQADITNDILPLTSRLLRYLWSIIEDTNVYAILKYSDNDLLQFLVIALNEKIPMTAEEVASVNNYIYSRLPLIRDVAISRLDSE